jgi:probable rRNA maturation factor
MNHMKSKGELDELLAKVQVLNKQRLFKMNRDSVALFCLRVIRLVAEKEGTLSVVFLNPARMRAINGAYRGRDYATDVLSFSYERTRMEGKQFLGEIIIAPEIAAVQARRYGTPVEREIRKLLVHGILHLLGYNHETDKGEMNQLQNRLLRRKALAGSSPLVALKEIR